MSVKFQKEYLSCCSGFVEDDRLYVVDRFFGTLMEYNIENYSYNVIAQLDFLDIRLQYRARKIIKLEDTFYFFFENSRNIYTWEINSKSSGQYGNETESDKREVVVSDAFLIKETIWIIPGWSDQPLRCFCVDTEEMQEYVSIEQQLEKFGIVLEHRQVIDVAIDAENVIWYVLNGKPYIISHDVELNEWEVHVLGEEEHLSGIYCDEKDLWICFTDKSDFISWNPRNGVLDTYTIQVDRLNMEENDPYHFICSYKDNIYVIPYFDNDIFIINKQTKEVSPTNFLLNYNHTEVRPRPPVPLFFGFVRREKMLIVLPYSIDKIVVIDMESGSLRYIEGRKSLIEYSDYLKAVYQKNIDESDVLLEGHLGFYLRDFISCIKVGDMNECKLKQQDFVGTKIFYKTTGF